MANDTTTNASALDHSNHLRSKSAIITLSFFMLLIIILSVCGNALLIATILRNKRLRTSFANKLIVSLAIADFLTALFPLTYQLATVIDISLISSGGLLCKIGGLSAYALFYASLLGMVMLSLDRLIALGFPLQYAIRMTMKVRVTMLAYPWVHGILFYIFCFIFVDVEFEWKSLACGFTWDKVPVGFTIYVLVVHITLPFIALTVLCIWSVCLVRAQNKEMFLRTRIEPTTEDSTDAQQRLRTVRRASEIKLAQISIAIVSIFLISWCPYVVTRALIAFAGTSFDTNTLAATALIVYVSLFSNPIIYSSLRSDLRRQMLCCMDVPSRRSMTTTERDNSTQ